MPIAMGRVGVWTSARSWAGAADAADLAAEVEALGFGAIWAAMPTGDLAVPSTLLGATSRLIVATGVVSVWAEPAATIAASEQRLPSRERFVLGLGSSHSLLVGESYHRPLSRLVAYLDELDAIEPTVPVERRVLAALGPKTLAVAAARTAGAHPYLVTPDHTRMAREIMGPGALLAPEQKVVLSSEPSVAREVARGMVELYLGFPNYVNNLRRLGFGDEDFADHGSDRLVDSLVAWGDDDAIRRRVVEHLDAGADHVCIQVLTGGWHLPVSEWRTIAPALVTA
jgi:probable F420-dependent oxidoreductase